jgi:hypothetical protein
LRERSLSGTSRGGFYPNYEIAAEFMSTVADLGINVKIELKDNFSLRL